MRGCRRRFLGWRRKCLPPEISFDCAGLFANKSNRRTAAPTFEMHSIVGAGLLAKASAQATHLLNLQPKSSNTTIGRFCLTAI